MKSIKLVLLALLSTSFVNKADALETSTLTVKIDSFSKVEGILTVKLHNSQLAYKEDKPFKIFSKKITDNFELAVFEDVPFGEYALVWHQDSNSNNKFDTNFLGIPKEPYGFSNNERGKFGPPTYDKIRFIINAKETTVTLSAD